MKVLFGTTNESKLKSMRRVTDDLGIELKGYCEIALGVNRDNTAAVGLYKSLGFTIYEEAEDKDGKFFRMEMIL